MGYCYVVFDGPEMVAAFKARRRKWQLTVTEFQGDPAARRIVDLWESENELAVEEQVDRISDHEAMEWYAKMYSRGAGDTGFSEGRGPAHSGAFPCAPSGC